MSQGRLLSINFSPPLCQALLGKYICQSGSVLFKPAKNLLLGYLQYWLDMPERIVKIKSNYLDSVAAHITVDKEVTNKI
jgi:hypothetical protein